MEFISDLDFKLKHFYWSFLKLGLILYLYYRFITIL